MMRLKIMVALLAVAITLAGASVSRAQDIVDVAASNKDFSTLVAAVKAAGLVDALKGEGPFTVFAPTNKAFEKLPKGTVESLLKPENKDKLVEILTYHVIPGKVMAADVAGLQSGTKVKTLSGAEVTVKKSGNSIFLNTSKIVATDVVASNGVIHVIDSVLLPSKSDKKPSSHGSQGGGGCCSR
ncbi:MAG: beta-Ig-H3/fasciclin [Armatimonadota bacterium]|nr:MAG: beta-Ig-H3/fasciclin [Armatimonadota bacterium]